MLEGGRHALDLASGYAQLCGLSAPIGNDTCHLLGDGRCVCLFQTVVMGRFQRQLDGSLRIIHVEGCGEGTRTTVLIDDTAPLVLKFRDEIGEETVRRRLKPE
jgi:hypothetical protein